MLDDFFNGLSSNRRIVIHYPFIASEKIVNCIRENDIVFFDDCLYSQYLFIKENIEMLERKNARCILGFSSGLYASESSKNTIGIKSEHAHMLCNQKIADLNQADQLREANDECLRPFMKVSQIKEILQHRAFKLALHGCCHLDFQAMEKTQVEKAVLFKKDLEDGMKRLDMLGLHADMFIYPYAYSFFNTDKMLEKHGFAHVIGSKLFRFSIEALFDGGLYAVCDS